MVWRWPDRHAAGRPAIPCTLAVVLPVLVTSTGRQIGVGQAEMCTGTASSPALHLRGGAAVVVSPLAAASVGGERW